MVVDIENPDAVDRLLWYVRGREPSSVYIDAVIVRHERGYWASVWGYSVHRRSPGFRTLGLCPRHHQAEGWVGFWNVFDDREEAIAFYLSKNKCDARPIEKIREQITPPMKFLKKSGIRHNLTEII